MGVVFLGRDSVLDRPVAIKVLRPEAATAIAAERFLREARVLAKLNHPNIVTIHQAGHAGGLYYFVMDRIEGETLADRLARGPLTPAEVRRIGRDILGAIATIHRAGVVHRDLKPANILLAGDRPVVTDFGIAREDYGLPSDLTATGLVFGTPAYMAPEQALGLPATAQSDLFSIGATLYEAATGRRFEPHDPDPWSPVPASLAGALRRALATQPERRWPSAEIFRDALAGPWTRRMIGALTGAILAAAVLGGMMWWRRPPGNGAPLRLRLSVAPATIVGPVSPALRDSMQGALIRRLRGYPDFEIEGHGGDGGAFEVDMVLHAESPGLRLVTTLKDHGRIVATSTPTVAAFSQWSLLIDSTSDAMAQAVLAGPLRGDPWLPSEALPRSSASLRRFLDGERAWAAGRWEEAYGAYVEAERADSSCLLCTFRLDDVSRWLGRPTDSARTRSLWAAADRFPPHYQALIHASRLPIAERLDALQAATVKYRDFDLVWYRYGEELFHRGPLAGRLRGEASEVIRHTLQIRPDLIPGWHHLASIAIADGDSVEAVRALARYRQLETADTGVPMAQLALVRVAFSWRFGDLTTTGPETTAQLSHDPRVSADMLLMGPRLLLGFEAWRGARWLGQSFAAQPGPSERVRFGLVAVALADIALGDRDSAQAALASLADRVPDDATALFVAGMPAVVDLADAEALNPSVARTHVARLRPFLDPTAYRPTVRRAAAFLLGAVATAGDLSSERADAMAALAGPDELAGANRALIDLLQMAHVGGEGNMAVQTDSILNRYPQLSEEQPATVAVMRFAAASWLAHRGRTEAATRILRWVEHQDVDALRPGAPVAAEIEWALTPYARWREARLVDRTDGHRARACRLYALIEATWRSGDSASRARATEAGNRLTALACGGGR